MVLLSKKMKQAKKAEEEAGSAGGGTGPSKAPVPQKKVPAKKSDNLDDLLNAGLTTTKRRK